MEWNCKAKHCPDRTGKLEEICKRCSTYLDKDKDCPWLCCESWPEECNKDSLYCMRCERYDMCYKKEKTLLDLHPAICERAVDLYFEGKPLKEAIEQAKKEYEGVIEMAQTKCRLDIESVCSKQIPCEACNDLYREEVDQEPVKDGDKVE